MKNCFLTSVGYFLHLIINFQFTILVIFVVLFSLVFCSPHLHLLSQLLCRRYSLPNLVNFPRITEPVLPSQTDATTIRVEGGSLEMI
ncbi:hypothetical protein DsansV1_C06g0067431 [Dioscorea sansibarensis]